MYKIENPSAFVRIQSFLRAYKMPALILGFLSIILLTIGVSPTVSLFIVIGIVSMYPMRYVPWLGIELCTFFTVFTSMMYGPAVGILVGKVVNIVGVSLAGLLDESIVYDFIALFVIAVIAAMFPPEYIVVVGISMSLLYHAGYVAYNKALDIFESDDLLYTVTNILFNIAIFWRLGPIIVKMFV